jgi:hypothetical protein
MDYNQLLTQLQNASLFDLYRLQTGIDEMLNQPERISAIKSRLKNKMQITYFTARENCLISATVEEIQRTRLTVRNIDDGMRCDIRFCMVNIDEIGSSNNPPQGQIDRNRPKVGDYLGFRDKKQLEQSGEILKLNKNTVTILTKFGTKLRVEYGSLFTLNGGADKQAPQDELIAEKVESDSKTRVSPLGNKRIDCKPVSQIPETDLPEETETKTTAPKERLLALRKKMQDKKEAKATATTHSEDKHGRNRPCPCGSGKRFKKCCIGKSKLP